MTMVQYYLLCFLRLQGRQFFSVRRVSRVALFMTADSTPKCKVVATRRLFLRKQHNLGSGRLHSDPEIENYSKNRILSKYLVCRVIIKANYPKLKWLPFFQKLFSCQDNIYTSISTFTSVYPCVRLFIICTSAFYHVHGSRQLIRLLLQLGCPDFVRIPSNL